MLGVTANKNAVLVTLSVTIRGRFAGTLLHGSKKIGKEHEITPFKKLVIAGLLSITIALSGYVSLTPSQAATHVTQKGWTSSITQKDRETRLFTDRRSKLIDTL